LKNVEIRTGSTKSGEKIRNPEICALKRELEDISRIAPSRRAIVVEFWLKLVRRARNELN